MLVKFEQNRMIQITRNFELFDKNRVFNNHFWQRVDTILKDLSVAEIIFNAKLKFQDYHLSVFQKKIRLSDTCRPN